MPRCKHCKEVFKPKYFNQKYHLDRDECIKAMVEENNVKKAKYEAKEWSNEKKERKEKLKTHSDWLKDFEKVFNEFIRVRDFKENCISCNAKAGEYTLTAGHHFPAGSFGNVRFDEFNVNSQCWWNCNKNQHGAFPDYRIGLIKKIGLEEYEKLEKRAYQDTLKLSVPEIKEKIQEYKQKIKQLKNETT